MKKSDVLDAIEEAYLESTAAEFPDVDTAVSVVASALRYLTNQCEDDEESG